MQENRLLVRWTIGPVTPAGFDALAISIHNWLLIYPNSDLFLCFNCEVHQLNSLITEFPSITLIDQKEPRYYSRIIEPVGVAWKLYPPRLDRSRHEILIDNDLILHEPIKQIDEFISGDCALLLEGDSRTYGRFEKHVAPGYQINSGIYGMPPEFDLQKYIDFYAGSAWELNAYGDHAASKTFDEQGLVAVALLSYPRFVIIPNHVVTNCERQLVAGAGQHFISLNRNQYHEPFRLYKSQKVKLHL